MSDNIQPEIKDITWHDFKYYTKELAADIKITRHRRCRERGWTDRYCGIIAITRGGLVVAQQLLHIPGIETIFRRWPVWVDTVCVRSYEGMRKTHVEIYKFPNIAHRQSPVLIVDDLSDTGDTLITIKDLYSHAHAAVLFTKPQGDGAAEFAAQRLTNSPWIKFPWELES